MTTRKGLIDFLSLPPSLSLSVDAFSENENKRPKKKKSKKNGLHQKRYVHWLIETSDDAEWWWERAFETVQSAQVAILFVPFFISF